MSDEYEPVRRSLRVWKRGFQPPDKTGIDDHGSSYHTVVCPGCGTQGHLIYTGETYKDYAHEYMCMVCGNKVGSPVANYECNLMDGVYEKDAFYTPCLKCPHREEPAPGEGGGVMPEICVHFRLVKWWPL